MANTVNPNPPLILAVETSAPGGGAALLRGRTVLAERSLGEGQRQAQNLLPVAGGLLASAGDAAGGGVPTFVAVSRGPGSYTGTRLGVMAAKALAYAWGIPLVGVSSLAALARAARPDAAATVAVVQPARRDEVYFAIYEADDDTGQPVARLPDAAVSPEEARQVLAEAAAAGKQMVLAGGGVATYAPLWEGLPATVTRYGSWTAASAAAVGRLALARWLAGGVDDPLTMQPVYLRRAGDPGWRTDPAIATAGGTV